MPYAIAASAIPIIAFAPITNAWFGPFGKTSKMAIAAVLCFFPVFVNTLRGLTSVRPASIELMRSYAAGEIDIFRRVRFPTALPFLFTALKIATVLSMIGAIVGEYFGRLPEALGVLINSRTQPSTSRRPGPGSGSPAPSGSRSTSPWLPWSDLLSGERHRQRTDDGAESPRTGSTTRRTRCSRKDWHWLRSRPPRRSG